MIDVAVLALHGTVPFDLAIACDVFGRVELSDGRPGYRVRVCGEAPEVRAVAFGIRAPWTLRAAAAKGARFNVALSHMAPSELEVAIERLSAPRGSPLRMPPAGRREIDPAELQPLIGYLKNVRRSTDDDALLERASQLGMVPQEAY